MKRLILTCKCGGSMRVPDSAMGEDGYCVHCGAKIRVRSWNTEREIRPEDDTDLSDPGNAEPQLGSAVSTDADTTPAPEPDNEVNLFFEEEAPEASPATVAKTATQAEKDVALFAASEQAAATPSAARAVADTCARCGRPFRGDWDRFRRDKGTVCYICANILRSEEGEHIAQLEEEKTPPVDPTLGQSWDRLEAETARLQAAHDDKRSRNRQMAALAVIFAIVAVAVLLWPSSKTPSEDRARRHAATQSHMPTNTSGPKENPNTKRIVSNPVLLTGTIIIIILALYMISRIRKKLPQETLWGNLWAVSVLALLIFLLIFIIDMTVTRLTSSDIGLPIMGVIATVLVLMVVLDFTIIDLVCLAVFGRIEFTPWWWQGWRRWRH